MMEHAITQFPKQFAWKPTIAYSQKLRRAKQYIVLGMGGSHLAADILQALQPTVPCHIHQDYGLPVNATKDTLIIASSYSGNTEEVLDGFMQAHAKRLPIIVIAVGGKLIELAKKMQIPHIILPNTGIQPRSALGFSLLALVKIMGTGPVRTQLKNITDQLDMPAAQRIGTSVARTIRGHVPVIYTSRRNFAISYNWKIKLNETGKIPAFYNVIPELNHNEMTGFDGSKKAQAFNKYFCAIFISDADDHPRIQKRMVILKKQYQARGINTTLVPATGQSPLAKILQSLLIADWCAVEIAKHYQSEPEQVPMVEEFKKLMA